MSFISLALYLLFYFCISTNGRVHDTPGGNLVLKFRRFPGVCPKLPDAVYAPKEQKMHEGRWYIILTGILPAQAQTLTCEVWDLFFDQTGILHNFISVSENGELKTKVTRMTPIRKRRNVFILELGQERQLHANFITSHYYVDDDLLVSGSVGCKFNGTHYSNLVVGVRNLKTTFRRFSRINELINDLEVRTKFEPDETTIFHNDCVYPPPTRNPYE